MRLSCGILFFCILVLHFGVLTTWAGTSPNDLEKIIKGMEARYTGKGFKANFSQESTLKAMQIKDTAQGNLIVKKPGKMRWEYIQPDPQTIITDGKSLWIYRPADNQVMVGQAPDFFGDGKGAGFLSNIKQIRKSFHIKLQASENAKYFRLQLIPMNPTPDIAKIYLSVEKMTFQVDQVVTYNAYGDETKILLSNYQFNLDPKEGLFVFHIPKGVDVVRIDQP